MKIMATFDGSKHSESTLPQLTQMARMPGVEFVLVRVDEAPAGRPASGRTPPPSIILTGATTLVEPGDAPLAETKSQGVERVLAEMTDYLRDIASRLPPGSACRFEPRIGDHAAAEIVRLALAERPDVIVMATHGRTGVVRALFGATAEEVVRSGVAPIYLVHPEEARKRFEPEAN
jgi:nucleotide-binding universal stress UspA family protein